MHRCHRQVRVDIPSEHLVPEFGSIFTCSNDQIMITVKKTAQSAGLGGLYLYRDSGVFKSPAIVKRRKVSVYMMLAEVADAP